jgi:hypothetical protein
VEGISPRIQDEGGLRRPAQGERLGPLTTKLDKFEVDKLRTARFTVMDGIAGRRAPALFHGVF